MKSRKQFSLEYTKQEWKMRRLLPESTEKYNPAVHFLPFEESAYLADSMNGVPYATFTTDDREEMENILYNGYADADGVVWTAFFPYWKDQEGHCFLAPENAGIKDLRDVGIRTEMKTQADFMKVAKYANRLFAALPEGVDAIWGEEVSYNKEDGMAIVRVDVASSDLTEEDRELSIRYVDLKTLSDEQKALVDGCIIIGEKAAMVLGLSKEPRLGMAWRGTFGTQRGLGKGHIMYKNDMNVDIVIYGVKGILKTDKFVFGSMGELHVGSPHTDRQAFVNFHYHRPGLAVDLAKDYMKSVFAASKDEAKLRELFLKYTKDLKHADMDQEGWILRKALAYGISFLRFPGLYRRVVRYLAGPDSPVFQCDQRARIPMETIANYGYVLPDPNAIDSEGDVVLDEAIPEGHIVFPDVRPGTKVVCYRQPSENTNAWQALTVKYRPEYKRFAGRGICLLGRGAHKVLGRLGGGDMDDQFVIVHDPKWVEAFHTMRPYPETEKLSADLVDVSLENTQLAGFTEDLMAEIRDTNTGHYTNKHASWQIEMSKQARAGIGPVVNFGIIDMLMSDPEHKASMLKDLDDVHAQWLEQREPWQAAKLMTNLEIVIDGNVKDSSLLAQLGDVTGQIKAFHANCQVYPESMASRIPASKQEAGGYVLAKSVMCRALAHIRALRGRMAEVFTEREWSLVAPADNELRVYYPRERELRNLVRGEWRKEEGEWVRKDSDSLSIMDIWATKWKEEMMKEGSHEGAYERICSELSTFLAEYDDDMMERIAVEVYYQTYRTYQPGPRVDETTGQMRGFNDGLLWSPVFGHHFINALRHARLCGYYKSIEMRPEFRSRLIGKSVVIEIRAHNVYVMDSDDQFTVWVGFVLGRSPDGQYRMDSGLVRFRKPAPICMPDDENLVAQKQLTRVIPSKNVKEETQADDKKGTFGKLLDKALNILK